MMQPAIVVRDAKKSYGPNANILKGLNLTVAKGSIYGLLGSSGCGKTTLLSCVVGVRQLDSGELWVLGGKPGSKGSGIPGPRVGYMPQDISLVDEFSVIDAFYYFGRINGLSDAIIEERFEELKVLLQLPPKNRLIKSMSGGQQRRVSFAAALAHKPELLILDEPTVGLDPVLRDNIWNYLVKITREDGVTVVITTHYIEEAKQADRIGLLRLGQLLAESTPKEVMERFQTDSLEEAFLALSQIQGNGQNTDNPALDSPRVNINVSDLPVKEFEGRREVPSYKRLQALLVKSVKQFVRHPGEILFSMCLPLVQIVIFFNSIGGDPQNLKLSVVNYEAGDCDGGLYRGNVTYDVQEYACNFVDLSCRFLNAINDSLVEKVYYDDLIDAKGDVSSKGTVGVMHFSRNFSEALESYINNMLTTPDADLIASQIQVFLDMGDMQIGYYIQSKFYNIFFEVFEGIMRECHISPKVADMPIRFEEPIYGTRDQNILTFMVPVFLLSMQFFVTTSVCSSIIITDRHSGVWDRSLVQGVKTAEILITHLLTQLTIILMQVTLTLCMSFLYYDVQCNGPISGAIFLMILEGICGMSYGLLISIVCTSHTLANYIATGSFYPTILVCGIIWPIEGMPTVLKWFSLALPVTLPGISLRGLLDKGQGLDESDVYTGFLVLSGWTVIFICISLYSLKSKGL